MEYTELGSTGVDVSVLSLGAGGSSKLGLGTEQTAQDAQRVVETALDEGITLIDTAEVYGTEAVIGDVITDYDRDDLVLSTKFSLYEDDELRSPDALEESLKQSLERLNTDYVDVYHLHGVKPGDYEYAVESLYPRLERLQQDGTIRLVGITEATATDTTHEMLTRAVDDGIWDVVMVGFNLLNHSARERVLEPAVEKGIGTICMVAVRTALSDPDALTETIDELIETGEIDPQVVNREEPFDFLVHEDGADSLIDAAYRFCRYEPAVDTVLTGTASPDHLRTNVDSVEKGPLPEADRSQLEEQFGRVDSVIGN